MLEWRGLQTDSSKYGQQQQRRPDRRWWTAVHETDSEEAEQMCLWATNYREPENQLSTSRKWKKKQLSGMDYLYPGHYRLIHL